MEKVTLNAKLRELTGRQATQVRNAGNIPAVVYGHGFENANMQIDAREFEKIYRDAGEATLIELVIEGVSEPRNVLIQEVQRHPLLHTPIHIDFRQVNMNETIETEIPLVFVGESPAVKALGAIFTQNMDTLTVRCLPTALVSEIEIDLGLLTKLDQHLSVSDITIPAGMEVVDDPETVIAVAGAPMSEEELQASLSGDVTVDVANIEVATAKKEKDEAAE